MAVAVVGFDVGSLTSYIGAARAGGIEVLANEYSDRCTPTCVSFSKGSRCVGTSAEQQSITNLKNTVTTFTRLLGKMYNDEIVAKEVEYALYRIKPDKDGRAGVEVEVDGQPLVLLPEQLLAMQLHKLVDIAEKALSSKVVDIVLNVPTYYSDRERRAALDAARIAGLNCVRIVNDTTAIGIAYGIYNRDLPGPEEAPRNVAFVSLGNSSLQVSISAFNQGKMKVLSTASDPCLGGRDFDMCIFKHMAEEIKEQYKIDVFKSPKSRARLLKSCEKLKKVMSTNSTDIPLNVECLTEDRDFSSSMKREFFEDLCQPLLIRVRNTLQRALDAAGLKPDNVQFVELVGGGTRIPAVKRIVADVFGKEGRTTLNADEAVARGCALQAAICSPAYKVREFAVVDACQYSICIQEVDKGATMAQEIYPELAPFPSSKQLTYYKKSDFGLRAVYSAPASLHIKDPEIGSFQVLNIVPENDAACEVRIKVRVDANGIFSVRKASIVDKVEKEVEVPIEEKPSDPAQKMETKAEGDSQSDAVEATEGGNPTPQQPEPMAVDGVTTAGPPQPEKPKTQKVKKLVSRLRDVSVNTSNKQLTPAQVIEFTEFEAKLDQQDKLERDRQHWKNSLEEYVYDLRSKLEGPLSQFVLKEERSNFSQQLTDAEDWVYGDGEFAKRSEIQQRLEELKSAGERYKKRMTESERRPGAVDTLSRACMHYRKILDQYSAKDPAYDHLLKEDMDKVAGWLKETETFLYSTTSAIAAMKPTDDPSITADQILSEATNLEARCKPIVTRPKPAPPAPKAEAGEKGSESVSNPAAKGTPKKSKDVKANGVDPAGQEMDVD
nr:unnamed protein product [Spirometra erinaceieuropaei]